ncbi:MAG: bis(5'-nucleosyl)-tetraphosphatase (symmetrical) YqeK [Coriobacteriales bacterium]|nr:bis(5'-nucleosyl)-tetraphosphatase (symmetrical) YqeK [Coriobacteriales bacterium]
MSKKHTIVKKYEPWDPRGRTKVYYDAEQLARIESVKQDVSEQLAPKPRRLAHSLSVANTAEHLATIYGVDPFLARIAGLLHDWDKVTPRDELVAHARELGIDLGVPLERVEPLLHGKVTALDLPERYEWVPQEVWHAISCHTTADTHMSPLDKVLFVADGIEPGRPASEGIQSTRALVSAVSLDDLFWHSFVGGLVYVLEGGRYLYPGAIEIYNALAQTRAQAKK